MMSAGSTISPCAPALEASSKKSESIWRGTRSKRVFIRTKSPKSEERRHADPERQSFLSARIPPTVWSRTFKIEAVARFRAMSPLPFNQRNGASNWHRSRLLLSPTAQTYDSRTIIAVIFEPRSQGFILYLGTTWGNKSSRIPVWATMSSRSASTLFSPRPGIRYRPRSSSSADCLLTKHLSPSPSFRAATAIRIGILWLPTNSKHYSAHNVLIVGDDTQFRISEPDSSILQSKLISPLFRFLPKSAIHI